jgi:UDP-3-O-[3-hydroxymyristoyl] N-acetylglucosamine deacetylase/3-hydroxyacyl-[acyl-carrier-protein] dehydratase
MEKGLIKGGTLEAAIVIRGDTLLSKQPLRFADEFVRHKILDIVGDLMLSGKRILGHVIAVRPGHGPNTELARAIVKQYDQMRSMVPMPPSTSPRRGRARHQRGDEDPAAPLSLPAGGPHHRLRRVRTKCRGMKNVTINEPFFQGHFPGHPIMPGVLQLEAMAQVASIVLLRMPGNQGKIGYFMSANNVKWRRPVLPGDTLIIETEILKMKRSIATGIGRCIVNGQVVSEAELMFSVVDR